MPQAGARGQNLGHLNFFYDFIFSSQGELIVYQSIRRP